MIGLFIIAAVLATSSSKAVALTEEPLRRYVLAAGANSGGADRVQLRYAVSDAERFANVMVRMGGVDAADRTLLSEPDLTTFRDAMELLSREVAAGSGRTEVVIYYSGHADERGLMLGSERLSYRDLRAMMDAINTDVRIAVLDACASGAITRIKGGQRKEAFLVDVSSDTRGYAFLTSSSAEETAQESDRLKGSFFTHYLVSGMRGAADVSRDGKVTLNEAYQFAFHETLAQTVDTRGGAQHAAYDINLSGTGDVVMTDVRETSAALRLGEDLAGRVFVSNSDRDFVAELFKEGGRVIELGLEAGQYDIHLEREEELLLAKAELVDGGEMSLFEAQFKPVQRQATALRGPFPPDAAGRLNKRVRIEFHVGRVGPQPKELLLSTEGARAESIPAADEGFDAVTLPTDIEPWSLLAGFSFGYWMREDLALNLSFSALESSINNITGQATVGGALSSEDVSLMSVMLGVSRYYELPRMPSYVRGHTSAAIGTYLGEVKGATAGADAIRWKRTMRSLGGQLATGADVLLGKHLMLGARLGYNVMADFDEPLGGRDNYGGPEFNLTFSWLIGSGS